MNFKRVFRLLVPTLGTVISGILALGIVKIFSNNSLNNLGIFSTLRNFFQVAVVIVSCGGGVSVIKLRAENKNFDFYSIFIYHIITVLLCSTFSFLLSERISFFLFGNKDLSLFFKYSFLIFLSLSIIAFLKSVLIGDGNRLRAIVLQISPFLMMLLYLLFEINRDDIDFHFLFFFLIGFSVTALLAILFNLNEIKSSLWKFKRNIDFEKLSLITFFSTGLYMLSILFIKAFINKSFGVDQTGQFEIILSLFLNLSVLISASLTHFYIPRVVRGDFLRATLIFVTLVVLGYILVWLLKDIYFNFFNLKLEGIILKLFIFLLLGELLRGLVLITQFFFISSVFRKYHVVVECSFFISLVLSSYFFVESFVDVGLTYLIANSITFLVCISLIFINRKKVFYVKR